MGVLRRGAFVGGGAARDWSPERPRRRREGGGGPRHGGGKSGSVALSRRLISGEEAAAVAAHLAVGSGVGGEARCGVSMRRWHHRIAGERGREGTVCGDFAGKSSSFFGIANWSVAAVERGLRVLFLEFEGFFCKSVVEACWEPSDRRRTAGIARYCSYCSATGITVAVNSRRAPLRARNRPSFI